MNTRSTNWINKYIFFWIHKWIAYIIFWIHIWIAYKYMYINMIVHFYPLVRSLLVTVLYNKNIYIYTYIIKWTHINTKETYVWKVKAEGKLNIEPAWLVVVRSRATVINLLLVLCASVRQQQTDGLGKLYGRGVKILVSSLRTSNVKC